ncbi:hypothetical protein GCM10010201_30380 [Pilimelia columellifera subsp. columellifera]|uniref:Uncharacterized protein n=1 Tax=Pilimelia columellifera subsp. columellifera TaxID=706583 RepID=A0ABN3NQ11_9ACTN
MGSQAAAEGSTTIAPSGRPGVREGVDDEVADPGLCVDGAGRASFDADPSQPAATATPHKAMADAVLNRVIITRRWCVILEPFRHRRPESTRPQTFTSCLMTDSGSS